MSTPPVRRWRALLVLGLLAGLLGMHALEPVAVSAATSHQHHGAVASTVLAAHHGGCADGADGCGCGTHRVHHADATCASGAVPGGPVLPDLVPGVLVPPETADVPRVAAPTSEHGSRAPPSLAELQLLRI
ncbi:DUF6153 family protein [Streptomyces ochraceiscleroticus]|uniref:DUF6153 family protein n=1 Tax=Streptomyces ochraceiscleroticus TaxID=47761 RepID=A0ABW1MNW1_9ACTN|nr:DUF6153 family protein [Streptomyces ochraceiscleroticus]